MVTFFHLCVMITLLKFFIPKELPDKKLEFVEE